MELSPKARQYWLLFTTVGALVAARAFELWSPGRENHAKLALYLVAIVAAGASKIRLPGLLGTLSLNFFFILLGMMDLQLASAILIGLAGTLAQSLIRPRGNPGFSHVVFSAAIVPISILGASSLLGSPLVATLDPTGFLAVVLASAGYFAVNTIIVAGIAGLASGRRIPDVWREDLFWTFPQYLAVGLLVAAVRSAAALLPWQGMLVALPPLYLAYGAYRRYLRREEQRNLHTEQMAALHWRTIEALALAIQAKDDTTAAHLKRVRLYAMDAARELGLSAEEIQAVEAASLLLDIGKLAVPEYIVSKRGRLTPEEFDKMKIHPIVGAEILERVGFPYPVAPIVRSHHEKYDGSGYPDGLRGDEIPIGARILSAVDRLDSLTSARRYRPAVPVEDALRMLESEAGTSFDPAIVGILVRRCRELDAESRLDSERPESTFTTAIANARREVQMIVEITNDLGNSLGLDETLARLASRLNALSPHDSIAIFIRQGRKLVPQFTSGDAARALASLEVPVGLGLAGWVVANDLPILNGNPGIERSYMSDRQAEFSMRSVVSIPLKGQEEVVAVLSLYSAREDAFSQDHLRMLLAIRGKAGLAIENSLRFRHVKHAAEKDELTGLLNAGSLFRLLEQDLRDAADRKSTLAVIVMDLDGFKQANDQFGHLAGNRVLQEIANGLVESCRKTDRVARMGGDEFVLALPDADPPSVTALLARIRELGPEAGRKACEPDQGVAAAIGISCGVAMSPADGLDAETLLDVADQRMYEAKNEAKLRRASLNLAEAVARQSPAEISGGADTGVCSAETSLGASLPTAP